ncbi:MAG TPA: hypothetical protein VJ768_06130 [Anaerolineales bacterium]|nr:hypothetical protein [Anaerolineales bacterium]
MRKPTSAVRQVLNLIESDPKAAGQDRYIKPSSLAKGCMLYVAFELRGEPKPPLEGRIRRILSVGSDSHRRLQRGLSRQCLGQEVFFEVPEYRIHGFCDAILYLPGTPGKSGSFAGFWALEFKTTASRDFEVIRSADTPKEEHIRQAQIYLWGLETYYRHAIPLEGAIICYENRDTLEHQAFEVLFDAEAMEDLLGRVKTLLADVEADRLSEDVLPPEHWAHQYCPYLQVCEPGQLAMAWQAQQPKGLPDEVLADIIAKRIVAKKGAEKMTGKIGRTRSLADLAQDLDWE